MPIASPIIKHQGMYSGDHRNRDEVGKMKTEFRRHPLAIAIAVAAGLCVMPQAFAEQQAKDATALSDLTAKFNKLQEDFTETVKKLNNTPGGASRPEATGGSGAVMADC